MPDRERDKRSFLRIVRAAIRLGNAVYSVPAPGRHGDVFLLMPPADERIEDEEQGFLASDGQFYAREIALHIARDAGQIINKHGNERILFSEDLW